MLNKAKVSIKGDYYYREDKTSQPAIEILQRAARAAPQLDGLLAQVAITHGRDSSAEQRLAALRGVRPEPVATGAQVRPSAAPTPPDSGAASPTRPPSALP